MQHHQDPDLEAFNSDMGATRRRASATLRQSQQMPALGLTPETAAEDVNPLHYAAAMGDKKSLKATLEQSQLGSESQHLQTVHVRDAYGRTALVYAVVSDHLACAELLISHGTDVNAVDKEGRTALHWAAFHGKPKMIKALLNHGADPLALDAEGRGAMHLCGNNKNAKCFNMIAKAQGSNGHWTRADSTGLTPLHWASFHGRADIIKVILKRKVPSLAFDGEGKSAFHWVASTDSLESMKLLRAAFESNPVLDEATKQPFDVFNTRDVDGRTCLHIAVASGQERMVDYLLNNGAHGDVQDTVGRTPFIWASQLGKLKVMKLLLNRQSQYASIEDVHGSTPLHYAAQEGHSGVVSLLLSTGRLQDTKDSAGRTALMLGALSGSEETVKLLLNNGVS